MLFICFSTFSLHWVRIWIVVLRSRNESVSHKSVIMIGSSWTRKEQESRCGWFSVWWVCTIGTSSRFACVTLTSIVSCSFALDNEQRIIRSSALWSLWQRNSKSTTSSKHRYLIPSILAKDWIYDYNHGIYDWIHIDGDSWRSCNCYSCMGIAIHETTARGEREKRLTTMHWFDMEQMARKGENSILLWWRSSENCSGSAGVGYGRDSSFSSTISSYHDKHWEYIVKKRYRLSTAKPEINSLEFISNLWQEIVPPNNSIDW